MAVDPSPYWSPIGNRTVGYRVGILFSVVVIQMTGAYLAVALAQGIAHQMAGDSAKIAWLYGLGMVATRFISRGFIDLATSDRLGVMPGERVTEAIYFLAIALRGAPHALFLTWFGALMGAVHDFPDPILFATFLALLPLLSLDRLRHMPTVIIRNPRQLLLDRGSPLYRDVANRLKQPGWLETLKYVRKETGLSVRDAIMLMALIRNDAQSRGF